MTTQRSFGQILTLVSLALDDKSRSLVAGSPSCHFEGAIATEKSAVFVCRRSLRSLHSLRDDNGVGYISEIIVSRRMRVCTVFSLREMRQAGQSPAAVRTIAATDVSITAVVSGSASRFVIRKYFGNVPK